MHGSHFNPKDNLERYGWAEVGREAVVFQLKIDDRYFAVHAAISEFGFVAWEIFEHTVGNAEVEQFLREKIGPIFQGTNKVLILDNAANQRIETCMNTLKECVEGRFSYLSEYSPESNTAVRGVSLVRRWICNE